MNPIKTPLEMLYEQVGIPHMAVGGDAAKQFAARVAKAIAEYKRLNGVAPSAQEISGLEKHVAGLSYPTSGLRSGMSAAPRASYELATDPNLINPDLARDPFLTKMLTGRTTKGTNLRPLAQDITDPSVIKNIETKQIERELPSSITPSADYFAKRSQAIENEALSGGSLDILKESFAKKFGRYPNEDELNAVIAEFNPSRHQYGEKGIGIMSERPPTAKGMEDWRNAARNEGVEESYLFKRQGNYPQYIQDELSIQRGELPTTLVKDAKKIKATEAEPVSIYIDPETGLPVKVYPTMKAEGGHISPAEMQHLMIVLGHEPQKFAKGRGVGAANLALVAAPSLPEGIAALGSKTPTKALGTAFDIGSAFLPAPVQAALFGLAPSETGDATLDTWEAIKRAELEEMRAKSPVFLKPQPKNTPIESLDVFGFPKFR